MAGQSAIEFGQRLLSLLDTASFTASYKYATLLALIDEVLASVDEHGRPPAAVHGRAVGRRVLALYWPQARPFSESGPLRQSNTPGDIVSKVASARTQLGIPEHMSLNRARTRHPNEILRLEVAVEDTVLRYPIPLLQRFGTAKTALEQRFIYEYGWAPEKVPTDDRLVLVEGAGQALTSLAGLLRSVVQREWLHFVARRNSDALDEFRVERFLFGADRTSLLAVRKPLLGHQQGRCFYCGRAGTSWEVDHFLPWARWPDDGLDNLVVAHRTCNNNKRAALAGVTHLKRWWPRVQDGTASYEHLHHIAQTLGWPRRPDATAGAARALYLHQPAGTMSWLENDVVAPLEQRLVRAVFKAPPPADIAAEDDFTYGD